MPMKRVFKNDNKKMDLDSKIQNLLDEANKLAIEHVEKLARNVLKNNPKKVSEFLIAMGSWFFIDSKDEIIHDSLGDNLRNLRKMKGYIELEDFIDKWDNRLYLTGYGMRFKATGKKITDW